MATHHPLTASLAALLLTGCAYDSVSGQAPEYGDDRDYAYGRENIGDAGWDGEWNPAWTGVEQPGDQFGGQDVDSVDQFYEPLEPFGRWVETRWGRAFAPDVDRDWRPYTNGRWTEYKLWISDDPWGWATDHYGRWAHDDRIGWVWVPDTRWGPHWVAFRENEEYAGWAPIPPGVDYNIGVGFGNSYGGGFGYDNYNSWYGPSWVWAPASVIFLPQLNRRILPYNRNFNYWQRTRWQHWTPWQQGRGWAGNPGRNYWRGASNRSPISNRIGGSLGNPRPGYNQGYTNNNRRPQNGWNRPGSNQGRPNGWNGNRPNGQRADRQRPDGERVEGTSPDYGYRQRPAYAGQRPQGERPRTERPDGQRPDGQPRRQRWGDTPRPGLIPGAAPSAQTPSGERMGGYRQRPAYAENPGQPRQNWRGNNASPVSNGIGGAMANRQPRPQAQPQPTPQVARQSAPEVRQAPPPRSESYRAESNRADNNRGGNMRRESAGPRNFGGGGRNAGDGGTPNNNVIRD